MTFVHCGSDLMKMKVCEDYEKNQYIIIIIIAETNSNCIVGELWGNQLTLQWC